MKINKILFPTDFSDASENAFRYALKMAEDIEAKLEVINIYRVPTGGADYAATGMYDEMLKIAKETSTKRLMYLTQNYAKGKNIKTSSVYGIFNVDEIVEYANDNDFDLIILGTKGERNSFEKFIGSVTTGIMMNASCPVLAIPTNAEYKGINSVAFATDLIDDSKTVMRATEFANILGADFHIVHAKRRETPSESAGKGTELTEYPFGFTDFTMAEDRTIEEALDTYINEKDVDVLVMYIPKRKLWERIFHTSFTKKMTFHTKTPLLVWQE